MRVKCVANKGSELPEAVRRLTGNAEAAKFSPLPGETYEVYGIALWDGGTVHYLTHNQVVDFPVWSPADLFIVVDSGLPADWRFRYLGYGTDGRPSPVLGLWGYRQLVQDPDHYDLLADGDPEAVETFLQQTKRTGLSDARA